MNRINQLEEFLKESPQDPFLHYALTMEYVKLDDLERAKDLFTKLVQDFPDYVGTYYHFGKLLEKLHEQEAAIGIYEKGIQVARAKRNLHALGELQGAYNMLKGFDEDDDFE